MSRTDPLIIGIGSPWGDDRFGWMVVERLQSMSTMLQSELLTAERGSAELLQWLQHDRPTLLIDALRSDDQVGIVKVIEREALLGEVDAISSHQIDLRQILVLADTLGQLPRRLCLFGVTIDCWEVDAHHSAAIEAVVESICEAVVAQLTTWREGYRLNSVSP